jgi:hypothetical protein
VAGALHPDRARFLTAFVRYLEVRESRITFEGCDHPRFQQWAERWIKVAAMISKSATRLEEHLRVVHHRLAYVARHLDRWGDFKGRVIQRSHRNGLAIMDGIFQAVVQIHIRAQASRHFIAQGHRGNVISPVVSDEDSNKPIRESAKRQQTRTYPFQWFHWREVRPGYIAATRVRQWIAGATLIFYICEPGIPSHVSLIACWAAEGTWLEHSVSTKDATR